MSACSWLHLWVQLTISLTLLELHTLNVWRRLRTECQDLSFTLALVLGCFLICMCILLLLIPLQALVNTSSVSLVSSCDSGLVKGIVIFLNFLQPMLLRICGFYVCQPFTGSALIPYAKLGHKSSWSFSLMGIALSNSLSIHQRLLRW